MAGGKRWLAPEIIKMVPQPLNRYIEPFLGGGAVFFACKPNMALLSDSNADLIETYEAIKQGWQSVWDRLEWHQNVILMNIITLNVPRLRRLL